MKQPVEILTLRLFLEAADKVAQAVKGQSIGNGLPRCRAGVGHLIAITLEGAGGGRGIAAVDTQLDHYRAVRCTRGTVGSDVEIEQMTVTVLHGAGYNGGRIIVATTHDSNLARVLGNRIEALGKA